MMVELFSVIFAELNIGYKFEAVIYVNCLNE